MDVPAKQNTSQIEVSNPEFNEQFGHKTNKLTLERNTNLKSNNIHHKTYQLGVN